MGIPRKQAMGALRISFDERVDEADRRFVKLVLQILERFDILRDRVLFGDRQPVAVMERRGDRVAA